ncbi:MAG: alpha-E domain-containing protein [Verrucomicrobia bacterium]|nr:alpha-E domain-containing protein [Verrucomicrobiota bacterium]MCH8512656.1 alpha-E domain-containing protein [Kiritimatiellia bacterium]
MSDGTLLSRVAESIYWMSRYMERVENTVRLMDVNWHLMLDLPQVQTNEWESLLHVSGDFDLFKSAYEEVNAENVMRFMTFDLLNPNSMYACLTAARENARAVRDVVTPEMWELINSMYLMVKAYDSNARGFYRNPFEFYREIQDNVLHFYGVQHATTFRGQAWHFNQLGRMLERADKTSRILDVRYFLLLPSLREVGTALEDLQWAAMLRSVSSLEPFVKKYGPVHARGIIEYLLLDLQNPRSLRHCLKISDHSLRDISGTASGNHHNDAERRLGQLCADLNYLTVDEIIRQGLHECLDDLQIRMNQVHTAISEAYFNPDAGETT